jgi:hypothetical protein
MLSALCWSCSWTIIDDCVHRFEIVLSLPFGFELHSYPPVMGMIVLKEGKAFGFCVLELNSGLDELSGGGNISRIGYGC